MRKGFIGACIGAALVSYEGINHFFVLLFVGGFGFDEALKKVMRYSSLDSAMFFAPFHLAPFVCLALCAFSTKLMTSLKGRVSLYASLVATVLIIFLGYWSITSPLYTEAHASSTSALGYAFMPPFALICSIFVGMGAYISVEYYQKSFKRD